MPDSNRSRLRFFLQPPVRVGWLVPWLGLGSWAISLPSWAVPVPANPGAILAQAAPPQQTLPRPNPLPSPELKPPVPLPSPGELLQPIPDSPTPREIAPGDNGVTIVVERFQVLGSTVFSQQQLTELLKPYTGRPLTLVELLQARSAITQLYVKAGYINSGAYIPPQEPQNGVITVQVIEGKITDIQVTGNRRLQTSYVRDRLNLATAAPFNVNRLLEKLRLLKLDPLLSNISAELAAGVQPGTSILRVQVSEAPSFHVDLSTDNERSPTVGSWRRQVALREANLLGLGDSLSIGYINTAGSNEVNASYALPVNARNGTVQFRFGFTDSQVIEQPFDLLDIHSNTYLYELSYRQPIIQTPTEELALSLIASRQESRSLFLENLLGEGIPFPALGADQDGWIRVSALRFAQEWTKQMPQQVLALRSQFNLGLDLFGSTVNPSGPDSRFFSWQGQAQWVRLLAPDTILLLRGEAQLASDPLVPLEQFGLGGRRTVRGYRQDLLLTDNGLLASAEVRFPLYRDPALEGLLQGIVFFDLGRGWNQQQTDPDPNTLASLGLGLQWQMGNRFNARLDWGIPLIDAGPRGNSLQENGVYFSLVYRAF